MTLAKDRLMSVEAGTSAQTIAKMLRILFPDATTALDMTFGSGKFWSPKHPVSVAVTGLDLDPARARDVVGDFTALDFPDGSFDVCVFDPPYLSDVSRKNPGIVERRFGSYRHQRDVQEAVRRGCQEAWRVSRLGVIVKLQDFCHASQKVWMSRWAQESMPVEPYDAVHQISRSKIVDPMWNGSQLTAWSNNTTFWVWRKDGPVHRRRKPAYCTE